MAEGDAAHLRDGLPDIILPCGGAAVLRVAVAGHEFLQTVLCFLLFVAESCGEFVVLAHDRPLLLCLYLEELLLDLAYRGGVERALKVEP